MQGSSSGATSYTGVREARLVEISCPVYDVQVVLDVTGLLLTEAALAHDLMRTYASLYPNTERFDPNTERFDLNTERFDREPLNLPTLVAEMAGIVGQIVEPVEFLIEFVSHHPLKTVGAHLNEWVESLKHHLVALAPVAFSALQTRVIEEISRAGRQRKDENQIIPPIEGGDPALEDVKNADDDHELRSRLLMLCATPGAPNPKEPLTDRERHLLRDNKRLETLVEAKDAEIKALRENNLRTGHGARSSPHAGL